GDDGNGLSDHGESLERTFSKVTGFDEPSARLSQLQDFRVNPCRSELICGSLCSRTGSQSWSIRSWDCAVSCCARSWCSILGLLLGSQPPGPSARPCEPYGPHTASVQPLS